MELPAAEGWLVSCCFHVVQRCWSISVRAVSTSPCIVDFVEPRVHVCIRQSASIWSVELSTSTFRSLFNMFLSLLLFTCHNVICCIFSHSPSTSVVLGSCGSFRAQAYRLVLCFGLQVVNSSTPILMILVVPCVSWQLSLHTTVEIPERIRSSSY